MADNHPARRTRGPLEVWIEWTFRYWSRGVSLVFGVAALGAGVVGTFALLGFGPARGIAAILIAVMLWSWALGSGSLAIRGWIMSGPHNDAMPKPWEWIAVRALGLFLLAGAILLVTSRFAV